MGITEQLAKAYKEHSDYRIGNAIAQGIRESILPFVTHNVTLMLTERYLSLEVVYLIVELNILPGVEFKLAPDLSLMLNGWDDDFVVDTVRKFQEQFSNYRIEPEAHISLGEN